MTETKWLTIAEASLLCSQMGLERTPKTIRGWARNEHVIAQKKSTSNGEMWILDKASLETKIKTEIEYRDQMKASQTSANQSEPVQTSSTSSEPVRTRADQSDRVQTRADTFGGYKQGSHGGANPSETSREPRSDPSAEAKIKELESRVMALSIDVGWRDKLLEKYQRENEQGQESLQAQARYIGHLESDLLRLGGKPDQTFLAAPTPQEPKVDQAPPAGAEPEIIQPQRPHPDQSSFYQNYSG